MNCGRLLPDVLGVIGGSFASLIGKPTRWGIDPLDTMRRGAAAALLLAISTAPFSQGLQISLVLDHASDLTVFVPFEKDLLGTKYTPHKEDYAAAVGTTRLPVKDAKILHAQDGFAVVLTLDVSVSMKIFANAHV